MSDLVLALPHWYLRAGDNKEVELGDKGPEEQVVTSEPPCPLGGAPKWLEAKEPPPQSSQCPLSICPPLFLTVDQCLFHYLLV